MTWYDGRKTAGSTVASLGPQLGVGISNDNLAKCFTHNSERTFVKHYLQPRLKVDNFEGVESLNLIRSVHDRTGATEKHLLKSFAIDQKKALMQMVIPCQNVLQFLFKTGSAPVSAVMLLFFL